MTIARTDRTLVRSDGREIVPRRPPGARPILVPRKKEQARPRDRRVGREGQETAANPTVRGALRPSRGWGGPPRWCAGNLTAAGRQRWPPASHETATRCHAS